MLGSILITFVYIIVPPYKSTSLIMTLHFHFIVDGFPPESDGRELLFERLFAPLLSLLGAELTSERIETPLRLSSAVKAPDGKAVLYSYKYSASLESEDLELLFLSRNAITSWYLVVGQLVRLHPLPEYDYELLARPLQFELTGLH